MSVSINSISHLRNQWELGVKKVWKLKRILSQHKNKLLWKTKQKMTVKNPPDRMTPRYTLKQRDRSEKPDLNNNKPQPALSWLLLNQFDSHETFASTVYITRILLLSVDGKTQGAQEESRLTVKAGRWASLISVGLPYAGLRSLRCARVFVLHPHLFLFLFWHSASHHSSLPQPDKASQNIAPSRRLDAPSSTNSTRGDHSFR